MLFRSFPMSEEIVNAFESSELAAPASFEELETRMRLKGKVKRLELYGAFVDVGVGVDALIHISQLSNKPVNRVSDVLNVDDEIEVWVDKVDQERGQFTVTMVEPSQLDWSDLNEGQAYVGKVTRLENFGAFVDIGAPKEGLVHISELSYNYVNHPSEVVKTGDEVTVKVLGFNRRKRRIDLSMKALQEAPEGEATAGASDAFVDDYEEPEEMPTAMEIALRRALGEDSAQFTGDPDRKRSRARQGRSRRDRLRQEQESLLSRTLASREDA
jgi:ribosomal protein S1